MPEPREQMLSTVLIVMLRCWARAAENHPARVPDRSPNGARLRRKRLAQQPRTTGGTATHRMSKLSAAVVIGLISPPPLRG
jgi:hypothetical protein